MLRFELRLDGGTHTHRARAAVKTAVESEQTLELQPSLQLKQKRQARHWRVGGQPSWSLARLLPREVPLKERFTVVDAASMPTPTPLRAAIRALADMLVLRMSAREKNDFHSCEPAVRCWELRGVCTCIDLVLSSTIDATN